MIHNPKFYESFVIRIGIWFAIFYEALWVYSKNICEFDMILLWLGYELVVTCLVTGSGCGGHFAYVMPSGPLVGCICSILLEGV